MKNSTSPLILGSNSPRRKELLSQAGYTFEVRVSHAEEQVPPGLDLQEAAGYLSQVKAEALRSILREGELLVTADTVVLCDGRMLEKAATPEEATAMLRALSGKTHEVITGVTMLSTDFQKTFQDSTAVTFKTLSAAEIAFYIDTCKPFDKAGAYGIQEWIGLTCIERIEGSFFTVVGLPVHRLYAELTAIGRFPDRFPSSDGPGHPD